MKASASASWCSVKSRPGRYLTRLSRNPGIVGVTRGRLLLPSGLRDVGRGFGCARLGVALGEGGKASELMADRKTVA